jgi:hypothetical protein
MTALRTVLPLLATLGLTGCSLYGGGGDDDDQDPPAPVGRCGEPMPVDPEGTTTVWVVDGVELPSTYEQARALALDVDCDEGEYAENALGQVMAAIYSIENSDLNDEVQAMVDQGKLLHILQVRATSLRDAGGVGVTLRHGLDTDGDPTDNFDGGESFAIDSGRGRGTVSGYIMDGALTAFGEQLPVGITLPTMDEPLIIPLEAAHMDGTIDGQVMQGRIGGAIPDQAVDLVLIPFIHQALLHAVDRDCPQGVCEEGSFGELLLEVFDADGDGAISLAELRDDDLTQALLVPDVDLDDDGTNDALSFALGYHAVPAGIQ